MRPCSPIICHLSPFCPHCSKHGKGCQRAKEQDEEERLPPLDGNFEHALESGRDCDDIVSTILSQVQKEGAGLL